MTVVLLWAVAVTPGAGVERAGAQEASAAPRCPAEVGGQPLSVSVPFSATVRRVVDDQGRVGSASLLCAYGEGARPAAEITLTWVPGATPACGDVDTALASSVAAAAFDRAAADLAATVGGPCAAATARGLTFPAVLAGLVAGGALGALALGLVLRRRRARPTATVPVDRLEDPRRPRTPPADLVPVLGTLDGAGGRAFTRTGAGQLAALAALGYASGNTVVGDLARAGTLRALLTLRPARPELAAVARALAHQDEEADR